MSILMVQRREKCEKQPVERTNRRRKPEGNPHIIQHTVKHSKELNQNTNSRMVNGAKTDSKDAPLKPEE